MLTPGANLMLQLTPIIIDTSTYIIVNDACIGTDYYPLLTVIIIPIKVATPVPRVGGTGKRPEKSATNEAEERSNLRTGTGRNTPSLIFVKI